jgi:predicted TIM-barrel fold metal-dependent hydrolase
MKNIDFHTRFFSRSYFDALAAQSPLPGSAAEKLARAINAAGIELPPRDLEGHLARWLGEMDRYGVDHLVSIASVPEEIAAVGEAATLSRGRLIPFASLDPTSSGSVNALDEILVNHAFRGVFLSPAAHGYDLADNRLHPFLSTLAEHGAVVLVRCGIGRSKLRDALAIRRKIDLRLANPLSVATAANAFPDLNFVIAHFGGGFFRETLMVGDQCSNVYVDTAGSNKWARTQPTPPTLADIFERTLANFGPERILFGSDSSVFPVGWRHGRRTEQREALGGCGLSLSDMELVFGGNAARLLRKSL